MNRREKRALNNVLRLLESQVNVLIADKEEAAGAVALRIVCDPENQDATKDRELALTRNAEAAGCKQVLKLIQAAMHTFSWQEISEARAR